MSETKHPWCRDVSRDEAIRLAEDAAAAERTPLPDHRDLPQAVKELRERVARLENAAAPAANAGGEAKQEPVAWGVMWDHGGVVDTDNVFLDKSLAEEMVAENWYECTVVPLYAATVAESATTPQPPRGWLTEEERDALELASGYSHGEGDGRVSSILDALLARSTPPSVKVPHLDDLEFDERPVWESACEAWIAAIREAGGEVE